ncbi:autotransporter outer membrane beta-barrel domain-containing protein [Endomicrobium proavitum]|uniref:OmpA-like domain-containing protein n=1 Tax=Endomicrobium proavitum TaxID=1408281 RepID=A0A0G3WJ99_9BACT|nr:autotransporter outer membrane beta-barrel domain-containing protein [Endomicrobium proavitum]AKL98413.1 exported protein of unknown function [Endomicrobium proavitum]
MKKLLSAVIAFFVCVCHTVLDTVSMLNKKMDSDFHRNDKKSLSSKSSVILRAIALQDMLLLFAVIAGKLAALKHSGNKKAVTFSLLLATFSLFLAAPKTNAQTIPNGTIISGQTGQYDYDSIGDDVSFIDNHGSSVDGFIRHYSGAVLTVGERVLFSSNTSATGVGAFTSVNSKSEIVIGNNATFEYNSGFIGGAFSASVNGGSPSSIASSGAYIFIGNDARFTSNLAVQGGVMRIGSANTGSGSVPDALSLISIGKGAIFENNKAFATGGNAASANGAVAYLVNGNLVVDEGALFDGNNALVNSGVIHNSGGKVTLKGGSFINNYAFNGSAGVIYNTYQRNTTAGWQSTTYGMVFIENYIFEGNYSGLSGGAIVNLYGSFLDIKNTQFINNYSTSSYGGALYNTSTATFSGTIKFENNKTLLSMGGAMLNSTGFIDFTNAEISFIDNQAGANGGAVNTQGANSKFLVNASSISFTNNTSNTGNGGAIWSNKVVEIAGSVINFINNKAIAGAGGGVFAQAGSSITLEGSGNFIGNEAGSYGGAIYVSSSASVSIIANNGDIAFDNNKMNGSPNDIYIADWGVLNLGGAKDIYFKSGIGFNTTTSSMNIKVTKEGSGVVYLDYSNPYLSNLEFKEGSISLHSAGSNSVGRQLTINELDASASGNQKIYMNVKINGQIDDESDKIRIIDKYEGNIEIAGKQVGTMGALTAGDGMKAVEFGENAVINGNFSLEGGKIDNGAYEIRMYKGDDATFSDWSASADPRDYYLRTAVSGAGGNPVLTDVYKTMANMPILNVLLARAGMNSLEKRLGDLRGFGVGIAGVWSRVYGVNEKVKDMVDTNLSLMGIEAGFDVLVNREEKNKIYVGGMFGYTGALEAKTKLGVENSNGNGRGVSVGLYGSWIEESGWFVDLASRYFITSFDMANYSSIGDKLEYKPERDIWATGIEAGKTFKVEEDENKYIRIEPKLEVQYLMAGDDKTTVTNGVGSLEYGKANYVKGKANILIGYAVMKNGEVKYEPYIEIGYNHELAGKGKMSYSGVGYESNISGGGFEGALGIDVKVSENIYIYGQGNIESGEKFSAIGANVGVRIGIGEKGKEAAVVETKAKPAVVESTATAAVEKEDKDIEEAKARRKASIKAFSIKAASFGVGKSELTPKAKEDIKEMAQEIKKYEYTSVTIEGHTDASGKAEINQELSEKRAKSVREEFVKEGIEESKVRIIGFGHRMSVDTNETAAGRANNRRVEIFVE